MKFEASLDFAAALDRADPLAKFRDQFYFPEDSAGKPLLYFSGHSLGLQPKAARGMVETELEDWARLGVAGHEHARHPWIPYHELLAEGTAALTGALPDEVVVMNSLTVNLHLMMVSFYRPTAERFKIVIEPHTFPSDRYAVESQIRYNGFDPKTAVVEYTPDETFDRVALVLMGGLNYYSGQLYPMEAITKKAHAKGCVVGFDLAHAVGNVPLKLHDWNVDFAVWCSYKYLNAGPGAPGGCFVHERHHQKDLPRFAGWWGNNKKERFKMEEEFDPIPTAEGWQVSNPPILALAPLRASTDLFVEAGIEKLRSKSLQLTAYFEFLIDQARLPQINVITPKNSDERGAMLCLLVSKNGRELHRYLQENGVECDWREPDVIRAAPVPLYNSFKDVFRFYEVLKQYGRES